MTRTLICVAFLLLSIMLAEALTNSSATVSWTPTTDPTIRYDLRWAHFNNGWVWTPIANGLDSTKGLYGQTFTALPDTLGDRGGCWDARVVGGAWLSDSGQQVCLQLPLSSPAPIPVPIPTPVPVPVPTPVPTPAPDPALTARVASLEATLAALKKEVCDLKTVSTLRTALRKALGATTGCAK